MLDTGVVVQGRYRIVRLLGQGGMGSVYRAWDLRLKVPVALKELLPQPGLDAGTLEALRQQFEQEASVLARLNHPGLVRVTDYFEEQSNAYLVMDFVDGRSLADVIVQDGAQSEAKVTDWAKQLLEALAYCHAQGVVHRDIKPQNIVLRPEGKVVLVDFGLVKLWDPGDPRTRTVMRGMGTPEYAPPEQYGATTDHTGPPSDIYSLGATIYHLLTGQAPATATERMAIPEAFVPLRQRTPDVSDRVERLVMKALALSVSERWQTASEMLSVLVSGPLPTFEPLIPKTLVAPPEFGGVGGTGTPRPAPARPPVQQPSAEKDPVRHRSKTSWVVIAVGMLVCLAAGCLGFFFGLPLATSWLATATPSLPTQAVAVSTPAPTTPTLPGGGFRVAVQNDSPDKVCYVLISMSDSDQWGENWLADDETILSGARRVFDVPDGTYDVKLERCDASVMYTAWRIAAATTVTVGSPEAQVRFLVSNESIAPVCYVYISPTVADDWGHDQLGELELISSGQQRLFYLEPDIYDLQMLDCEGQTLTEDFGIGAWADLYWTISD